MNEALVRHGNKRVGPPPVPERMKRVIAYLLDVEDDLTKAAAHAGMAMYLAFRYMRQTHVRRFLLEQRQIRIDAARCGNIKALLDIRDNSGNAVARVNAARSIELMGAENEQAVGIGNPRHQQGPGVTIVMMMPDGSHKPVDPPMVDVTPTIEHEASPHAWPSTD